MNDYANLSKKEILRHTGMVKQVSGVTRFAYNDGNGRNIPAVRVKNGSGLDFTVLEGRNMDIYELEYKGINLAYFYKNGLTSPERVLHAANEFLGQACGGMMYTSGLMNSGPENTTDDGLFNPLHGRIGVMSVDNFAAEAAFDDADIFKIRLAGRSRESRLFMHNLTMTRNITTELNSNSFAVNDVVENETAYESKFSILYHVNFGYPFLDEGTEIIVPTGTETEARTDWSKENLDNCFHMIAPQEDYPEHLYFHKLPADSNGICHTMIINRKLKLAVELSYEAKVLPYLIEWKSMGSGDYALGVMPSTSLLRGRKAELELEGMTSVEGYAKVNTGFVFKIYDHLDNINKRASEISSNFKK